MPVARRVTVVALGVAMLLVGPAGAQTAEVEITENLFTPDDVTVRVGDAVHWSRARGSNGVHNVQEDSRIFRNRRPDDQPIDYTRVFSAGTFHYYCYTHGYPLEVDLEGMEGFVRVPVSIGPGPDGLPFRVRWAGSDTDTGRAFDVRYRVGGGAWRAWKKDTTRFSAIFGRNGNPVRLSAGRRYEFQVRSQKRVDTPRQVSGWSPSLTVPT